MEIDRASPFQAQATFHARARDPDASKLSRGTCHARADRVLN